MTFTENLEDARKQREQSEQNEVQNQKKEQLKNDFFSLHELWELWEKLKELVKPDEKDKIETRLLLKYEKNPENFNLKESLKQVILGENIW